MLCKDVGMLQETENELKQAVWNPPPKTKDKKTNDNLKLALICCTSYHSSLFYFSKHFSVFNGKKSISKKLLEYTGIQVVAISIE